MARPRGVGIAGAVQIGDNAALTVTDVIDNYGQLTLASGGNLSELYIGQAGTSGTVTLSGGGGVQMAGNAINNYIQGAAGWTLDNVDNTISGQGYVGNGEINIENDAAGVIDATSAGGLTIKSAGSTTNAGLIEATGTGVLILSTSEIVQTGGTLTTTGGGTMVTASADSAGLSNITLTAGSTFTGNDNSATYLIGTIVNQGTLALNSTGDTTDYRLGGGQTLTLTGGGVVSMGGAAGHDLIRDADAGTGALANVDNTIQGAGNVGNSQMTMDNRESGVVSANVSGQTLLLQMNAAGMTNEGTLQATDGGLLMVSGSTITNTGTIQALNGSAVAFAAGTTNNNVSSGTLTAGTWAAIATGGGATLTATGGAITRNAATITLSGIGSTVQFHTLFTNENVQASLTTNTTAGVLNLLNNQGFTGNSAFSNAGQITLGGGTFTETSLAYAGTLSGFGAVTDSGSSQISNNGGTLIASGGTLVLTPGVGGTGGTATIDPGAEMKVEGAVTGGQTFTVDASGTLELASSAVGQTQVLLPSAASWLDLDAPSQFAGTVEMGGGFGGTVDLAGVSSVTGSFDASTSLWTVDFAGGSITVADVASPAQLVTASDGSGGTDVAFAVCFCAGTMILTPNGEVPVERLAAGDHVVTWSGAARPIVWAGTGRLLAPAGRRTPATPVIVRKGALAANVPSRDLHVTKGHSLFVDNVLIPVEFLVNYRSIVWDDRAQEVTVYHIELATHDVLVADGAPAESYRDDGNRWLFQSVNSGWDLPPNEPCAPVLTGGATVDAIWRRLRDRSGPPLDLQLTDEPDLHLTVDGRRVDGQRTSDGIVFTLWSRPAEVWIDSRAAAPAELGVARDSRMLGVAFAWVALFKGARACTGCRRCIVLAGLPCVRAGYWVSLDRRACPDPTRAVRWLRRPDDIEVVVAWPDFLQRRRQDGAGGMTLGGSQPDRVAAVRRARLPWRAAQQ